MTFAPKRRRGETRESAKVDVSRMLNISRNTLDLWLKRGRTVALRAITRYQRAADIRLPTGNGLRFVQQHGDKTQDKWQSCGEIT